MTSFVQTYVDAIDSQRFDDAHSIARQAHDEFPHEIVIQAICEQAEMIQSLVRGERIDFTFSCGDGEEPPGVP